MPPAQEQDRSAAADCDGTIAYPAARRIQTAIDIADSIINTAFTEEHIEKL